MNSALRILALLLLVGLVVVENEDRAYAADTHTFNAQLSLTGGCKTSTLDPVPDPDCPAEAPGGPLISPQSVVTDEFGNIYVASTGVTPANRIDVFDPSGSLITEFETTGPPQTLAIDADGVLYVTQEGPAPRLVRYEPTLYEPELGIVEYGDPPATVVEDAPFSSFIALGVNKENSRLFAEFGAELNEYGSATDGNPLLDSDIVDTSNVSSGTAFAIDTSRGLIYTRHDGPQFRVFDLAPPHALVRTIDGSDTPAGAFKGLLAIAVDEGTGHLFVFEAEGRRVQELTEGGTYVSTITHGFQDIFGQQITVDNGAQSPNGALHPTGRYLFVPSHPTGEGHLFAFGPKPLEEAPAVGSTSVSGVTQSEVQLEAIIEPNGLETTYRFEYVTEQKFEEGGEFTDAITAGSGQIAAGNVPMPVSAIASGLEPGTRYRFRVIASNEEGSDEAQSAFGTYPSNPLGACPNDALRTGRSSVLPDCRAFELVTPADTNGRAPFGVEHLGVYFPTRHASPDGNAVTFQISGGSIPGYGGTGTFAADPYIARRGESGWGSIYAGPTASESPKLLPGSNSPDQGYSFWDTAGAEGAEGSAGLGGRTSYVRYPDGHSELLGKGSLEMIDIHAGGRLISENGGHIIFVSGASGLGPAVQLEPDAPPSGTRTIYDRTTDGVTHVVSLLPGDVTPTAGQDAFYEGASLDGEGVAFMIGSTLYLRHDNEETYEIGNVTFAGLAEGGERVFYLKGGDLYAFDASSEQTIVFANSPANNIVPVNVASEGTTAYFVSKTVLTGAPNPSGDAAQAGEENLYRSEEGAISFVGTVTERDVEGELKGNDPVEGLGLWMGAVGRRLARDPSRTTPDGSAIVFESRADLTDHEANGLAQVYLYDSSGELSCLSCDPTGSPATGRASLQSISQEQSSSEPFSSFAYVQNLRADGRRAFFQSEEALVPSDTDGLLDVYEWEDQGVGSCIAPGGCVYLISAGQSDNVDYLYAVSDSGDDVFIRTSDRLLPSDAEETPSIYDARVGGGFPGSSEVVCGSGESCHPPSTPAPLLPSPLTPALGLPDQAEKPKRCPKGKRKGKRNGKTVCVKKKQNKRPGHQANTNRRGASR